MAATAHVELMSALCSRPPEAGGILLGPIGSSEVTDFYFDKTAKCTGGTYTPDHVTLQRLMNEKWMPSGIDMVGFVHSHPNGFDWLSQGDLIYIRRLLLKNTDMAVFATPIVLPEQYRIRPIVVQRSDMNKALAAKLILF